MVKFKTDYNEETENPELVFEYNTASTELDVKIFKRFVELSQEESKKVIGEIVLNENGTTTVKLKIITESLND